MYINKLIFKRISYFCVLQICVILSTKFIFIQIKIRHYAVFCTNDTLFLPLTISDLNLLLKLKTKHILFPSTGFLYFKMRFLHVWTCICILRPNAPLFCEEIYCGSIFFHGVNVRGLSKFCCFVGDVISWITGLLHYKQDVNSLLSEVNSWGNGNTWNPRKLIAHEQWWFHIISRQLHLKDNSFITSHLNFLFTF